MAERLLLNGVRALISEETSGPVITASAGDLFIAAVLDATQITALQGYFLGLEYSSDNQLTWRKICGSEHEPSVRTGLLFANIIYETSVGIAATHYRSYVIPRTPIITRLGTGVSDQPINMAPETGVITPRG